MTGGVKSGRGGLFAANERRARIRLTVLAGILLGASVAAATVFNGSIIAALASLGGISLGYLLGRKDGPMPATIRSRMFRVADDLAQYRAFTRLLRDQGARITKTTGDAAMALVAGIGEIDASVDRLRALAERIASRDAEELGPLADALGASVVEMLGQLQFQDVTQQQIDFLARLSLIVDQHMIELAGQLGDRRSADRIGDFKDMFNKALDDCVMTSQREDHHVALGLDLHESNGLKVELF
ncbi:hypothetical protein [Telmatospirillum siberiense]|uniref:Uncharacterized protein n=1 Tax=Telmatospirillum siberiense TaxID=382514 RepID=A0A2N3Q1U7_9PROT|nr:hypothetical protein [Telmatospirillum siberiense]PKU26615.1 hypothetical protein CWS72_01935 [Telmatospirillum siberiense]